MTRPVPLPRHLGRSSWQARPLHHHCQRGQPLQRRGRAPQPLADPTRRPSRALSGGPPPPRLVSLRQRARPHPPGQEPLPRSAAALVGHSLRPTSLPSPSRCQPTNLASGGLTRVARACWRQRYLPGGLRGVRGFPPGLHRCMCRSLPGWSQHAPSAHQGSCWPTCHREIRVVPPQRGHGCGGAQAE